LRALINGSSRRRKREVKKKEYGQKNDVEIQAVTNQRVIHNTADHGDTRIYLKDRSSVVILNARTVSDFQSFVFYGGAYSHYSYGTAYSHSVGELQILDRQGHPVMLFSQIANPWNIKNLVQVEMKTIQYNVKELKEFMFGKNKRENTMFLARCEYQ
jgi:hypothetical protein